MDADIVKGLRDPKTLKLVKKVIKKSVNIH